MMHRVRGWLRALFRRSVVELEMQDEMRYHLEQTVARLMARGLSLEAARAEARREFGNVTHIQDEGRDARGVAAIEQVVRDISYAMRGLRRQPLFTAVVVATLALGIGANTAVFSIVHGVLLRPLDYPAPDRLMLLTAESPIHGGTGDALSAPEYAEFRRMTRSFSAVGAYSTGGAGYTTGEVNITAGDRPLRVRSIAVDSHLLEALSIPPESGRLFSDEETGRWSGTLPPPVAILSHELWRSAFGGQPLVGKTVEIEGRAHEIVGIMPPGVDVMDNVTQVWLPIWVHPSAARQRDIHGLYVVGRLKDGVTPAAAREELNAFVEDWAMRVGTKGHVPVSRPTRAADHSLQLRSLQDAVVGNAGRTIWVLQAAVGFVLLIVCANLANLTMARAASRRREFILRAALGASRGRLFRQSVTESAVMSAAGGILGLALAGGGVRAALHAYPISIPRVSALTIDGPVVLLALGLSAGTALLFGFVSLARGDVRSMVTALKDGTNGATGPRRHLTRRALVIAQLALAVILVVGASLLIQTVYNLTKVDAGFDRSRLVTFSMTLPMASSDPDTRAQADQRILDGLRAVPGVLRTAAMSGLPPNRAPDAIATPVENFTAGDDSAHAIIDYYQLVMGDYFGTMGIPIVAGRGFEPSDNTSHNKVAIVNETLATRLWKNRNPIGQRLRPPGRSFGAADDVWRTVIGVAKDVRQRGVERPPGGELYLSLDQDGVAPPTMNVVIRTTLPPAALSRTIQQVVREVDAAVPVVRLRDMDSVFEESIRRPRVLAQLLGVFGGLALLLAVIGTYGVLSHLVTERRREIGIRVALGATSADVLAQILKQGLQVTTVGVAIGISGALVVNRLIASLLFGVRPADGATIAVVVATVTTAVAGISWLPAWRASRLDPNVVLRDS
jgi:putative ABC transport system permease protein